MDFRLPSLALLGLVACAGPRGAAEDDQDLSAEEFEQLLSEGTIEPVVAGEPGAMAEEFVDPEVLAQATRGDLPADVQGDVQGDLTLEANPFVAFGQRIRVNRDGTITKPYPLRVGTGRKMEELIRSYGSFDLWVEGGTGPGLVKLETLPEWDIEILSDLRDPTQATGTPVPLADWLVVTTGPLLLREVENFINLFGAGVPQIEIEAKIVEIAFSETLDVGVDTNFTFPGNAFVKSLDVDTPNVADISEALLSVGGVQDGLAFSAMLEAIASNDNVSIISRPKIAVREGGRADIANTTKIPFLDITGISNTSGGGFNAKVSYEEVGTKLFVVPRVVGTDTVALSIDVEASQKTGDEPIVVNTETAEEVTVPVLSLRTARTTVYLQPGQAVILGGLITERSVDRVRKVPILGDIPLIQVLFRSKFTSKEQTNVLFFIRPRILQGSDLYREF
jgi:type II secretory pathway component GspD/PulD (secretin)